MKQEPFDFLELMLSRLERISADSIWAHRASGIRGALLRLVETADAGRPVDQISLTTMMTQGLMILDQAAREKIRKGKGHF